MDEVVEHLVNFKGDIPCFIAESQGTTTQTMRPPYFRLTHYTLSKKRDSVALHGPSVKSSISLTWKINTIPLKRLPLAYDSIINNASSFGNLFEPNKTTLEDIEVYQLHIAFENLQSYTNLLHLIDKPAGLLLLDPLHIILRTNSSFPFSLPIHHAESKVAPPCGTPSSDHS